jgi:hypothetical protein
MMVIGYMQKISIYDYLPLIMGPKAYAKLVGNYTSYNATVNPNLSTEFATVIFRYGHQTIATKYKYMNNNEVV